MRFLFSIVFILTSVFVFGQDIKKLYQDRNYQAIVKYEKDADNLLPGELYMMGYAFFQLENDDKAIAFYDKAIAKGLNEGYVHFYKALSLRYAKRNDEAIKEFDEAIKREPKNQEYLSEKAFLYYYNEDYDKALELFTQAKLLPNTFQAPYYMVPHIQHIKMDFEKALNGFYTALDSISKDNPYYVKTLADIGRLEYTHTKNFEKAAAAYSKAIAATPNDYTLYPKLMKALNSAKQYTKADSVFTVMKDAYNKKLLPEDDLKYKNTAVDEFEWNGQKLTVYRSFVEPKESLDISYKIYLLSKDGEKVERTFLIEKTLELPDSPRHLLCEKEKSTGTHYTYPYGWVEDSIPLEDLHKAVVMVLENKMKSSASLTPGN